MDRIKQGMRATWMAGDFGEVAKTIAHGAEEFAASLAIAPGARVLDVACGTGNVAIPLARIGAVVTGVDIAPNLLEQARARAAAEGLPVQFDEGDAEQLPYEDGSFDAVVSMFGAMFAPRPEVVAAELARVLKPGGMLAMANWNPTSFSGKLFQVSSRHASQAASNGLAPPVFWGDEARVLERLSPGFADIQVKIVPILFDLPTSPAGAVAFFRQYFGPTHVAFSRLDADGQAEMAADLEQLWVSANIASDPENHTLIANEYLRVVAVRR